MAGAGDERSPGRRREPPRIGELVDVLSRHGVRYVVTGSVAALVHGVPLEPGDLDITPALDRDNLERLARVLDEVGAAIDPRGSFGRWEVGADGERRWAAFEPTAEDRAARARWRPDPDDAASFDHLLETRYGALDVVPEVAGTYDRLRARAVAGEVDGRRVLVVSVQDQLASLTVPRRSRDAERIRALRALEE